MMMRANTGLSLKVPATFFVFAIVALLTMAVASFWTLPTLIGSYSASKDLAFVHLFTLGFAGAVIIGASYQLVPVVLECQLALPKLAWASMWCYLPGVIVFVVALSQAWLRMVAVGASLVSLGIATYSICIIATAFRAEHASVYRPVLAVAAFLASLGMSTGFALALNKSSGSMQAQTIRWLGAHIVIMVAGWLGLTLLSVAVKLIAMFTLAEQHVKPKGVLIQGAMLVAGVVSLSLNLLASGPRWVSLLGSLSILAALCLFVLQAGNLYRRRLRRQIDVHAPFAIISMCFLLTSAVMLVIGVGLGKVPGDRFWPLVLWLALWGGFGTAILGFLVKISTFLVWLQRYAPVAGKQSTPKLNEMYRVRPLYAGLILWIAGVASYAFTSGISTRAIMIASATPMLLGSALYVFTLVTIFRHLFVGRNAAPAVVRTTTWVAPHRASQRDSEVAVSHKE